MTERRGAPGQGWDSEVAGPARALSARGRTARVLVLTLLLLNVPAALLLAASQLVLVPAPFVLWGFGLLAGYAACLVLALHSAVTPWTSPVRRRVAAVCLMIITVALAGPLTVAAEPGATPWAWVAGFAIGALAVLYPSVLGLALGAGTALAGGLWSVMLGAAVRDLVVFTLVTATAVAATSALTVWLLGVLVQTETGRYAHTALAVTQERLRIARDLHDALVQNLTAIALKAELAEDLAGEHPQESAQQSRDIRALAQAGLHQTRSTLEGLDPLDLEQQLSTAAQVLRSAGVEVRVDADTRTLIPEVSRYLAAVVREGTTNVLRHSDATACTISLHEDQAGTHLKVINDRPRRASGVAGTGLRGLTDRGRDLGATLTTSLTKDQFVLEAQVPAVGP